MDKTIYLIGQISFKSVATYEWRKRVKSYFSSYSDVHIIDPCDNEFNTNELDVGNNGTKAELNKIIQATELNLLVPKDYTYVLDSDIAIANMNIFDRNKPTIGTMFELAWYYANPEKAVIGILGGDPKEFINTNHPFVRSTVDTWVQTEVEACRLVDKYFL